MKKVYHGSTLAVETPSLQPLTRRLDFGAGFYTTSDLTQARRWAGIKKRRMMADQIVFVTDKALSLLKFIGKEEVQDG